MRNRRRFGIGVAGLAVMIIGVSAAVAWASIPDSGGVIHACYANSGGALRVINTSAGQSCKATETSLTWKQGSLTWKGAWSGATTYAKNDAVSLNGSSYIAVSANTNKNPTTHPAIWNVLAQGSTGPRGPSNAYFATSDGIAANGFNLVQVLSLPLPAGTFAITAKINPNISDASPHGIACYLYSNGNFVDDSYANSSNGLNTSLVEETVVQLAAASTLTMSCLTDASSGSYDRNRIVAIQVATAVGAIPAVGARAQAPGKHAVSTR